MALHPFDYVGIPFVDRGRDAQRGLDCWGLVRHWYQHELGVLLPNLDEAPSGEHHPELLPALIEAQARQWRAVSAPERGDVLVLRHRHAITHVAVYVGVHFGRRRFLHTLRDQDSSYADLDSPFWLPRLAGVYRHAG